MKSLGNHLQSSAGSLKPLRIGKTRDYHRFLTAGNQTTVRTHAKTKCDGYKLLFSRLGTSSSKAPEVCHRSQEKPSCNHEMGGVARLMAAARPASLRRRIHFFFSTDELAFFTLVGRRDGRVARRFCFLKRLVDNLWLSKSYSHVLPCQVNVFLKIICWVGDLGCSGRRHGYGLLILPAQGRLDTPDLWITERRDYNCGCSKLTISTSGWRLLCTCIQDKNRHERGVCVWSK